MQPLQSLQPRAAGWTRLRLVTLAVLLAGAAGAVAFFALVTGVSANAVGGCGGG